MTAPDPPGPNTTTPSAPDPSAPGSSAPGPEAARAGAAGRGLGPGPGPAPGPGSGPVAFRHLVASEFTKLRSIRSPIWTLIVMAATTVGTALLVALTGSFHPDETVLTAALGNSTVGLVVAGAFGVLVIATEYSSGTIRATCAATPRRSAVVTAKAFVTAVPVYVVALLASAGAYGITAVLLDRDDHPLGNPLPALLGVAACSVAAALLGLALGTLLRNAAGGICAIVGVLLAPALFGPLLGDAERWVTGATPAAALQKLVTPAEGAAWPTLALAAYTGAALAASAYAFRTRDV
ncbi:ABC transporter permease [Cryptosporangium aurantiacum]|uniref:ABC-type transport system involved in multi-copper enzyme maturation, permease component n=1 Tax=Cryptosporangium aurantiacum TaxID=134849 RepID=A0A1M7Q3P1_9ACTN|nr:ABC transporter permease [Cryptosporangium aurantiacum]SHN24810.1 ABC-type transport system involved in multi-copper enzyme maturation, permease component [Cryptosporangium aurantiacum]